MERACNEALAAANEHPVLFSCGGSSLLGIVHEPEHVTRHGVLIVVGGPQYRVGSHRQFVLLARSLAERGIAAFRFDYRGIGDSSGEARTFLAIEQDLRSALDVFCSELPALTEIYIWGLCDAASAALMYAHRDARVKGLVIVNPWVRTEAGLARAYLKGYYARRLRSADFWRRLVRGQVAVSRALPSLLQNLSKAVLRKNSGEPASVAAESSPLAGTGRDSVTFPSLMLAGLKQFTGRVLIILSGDDLTADEFRSLTAGSRDWNEALADARVSRRELPEANHTFSRRIWRDRVAAWTTQWVLAE